MRPEIAIRVHRSRSIATAASLVVTGDGQAALTKTTARAPCAMPAARPDGAFHRSGPRCFVRAHVRAPHNAPSARAVL